MEILKILGNLIIEVTNFGPTEYFPGRLYQTLKILSQNSTRLLFGLCSIIKTKHKGMKHVIYVDIKLAHYLINQRNYQPPAGNQFFIRQDQFFFQMIPAAATWSREFKIHKADSVEQV